MCDPGHLSFSLPRCNMLPSLTIFELPPFRNFANDSRFLVVCFFHMFVSINVPGLFSNELRDSTRSTWSSL